MISRKPTILISSTVYGREEMLDQVYSTLSGFGYEVWMSSNGTLPLSSGNTAFENCLIAVEKCDYFLGVINGYYGSGVDGSKDSITHQELLKAIKLRKKRWLLVHNDVLVVRQFVKAIKRLEKEQSIDVCSRLRLSRNDPISDMRILKMYESATRSSISLKRRVGNWVQGFRTTNDVLRFVAAQLSDPGKLNIPLK